MFQDLRTTEELNVHITEKQRLQAELEHQLGKSKDLMDEMEDLRQNFVHQVTFSAQLWNNFDKFR